MKITIETSLEDFKAWSGAVDTKETILEHGKENEFESLIEECFLDREITDMTLNDLLWFESEWIYENLGIKDSDFETEEDRIEFVNNALDSICTIEKNPKNFDEEEYLIYKTEEYEELYDVLEEYFEYQYTEEEIQQTVWSLFGGNQDDNRLFYHGDYYHIVMKN